MLLLFMVVGGGAPPCNLTPPDLGALSWPGDCISFLLRRLLSLTGMAGLEKLYVLLLTPLGSIPLNLSILLGVTCLDACFLVRATAAPVTPRI